MKPIVLRELPRGMYAIGVMDGKRPSACIVNSVMQISGATPADPALLALSLNKDSFTCECIEKTGIFSITVLARETPATLIGALGFVSGRKADKLESFRYKILNEGVPVIKENTCGWFLCQVKSSTETKGQKVFVAEVTAGSDEFAGKPMTYEYYSEHLGGAAPKKAPVYLPPELTRDRTGGDSFVCSVCGYVYSDPNFSFGELPADWVCPICKMPKKAFVRKK